MEKMKTLGAKQLVQLDKDYSLTNDKDLFIEYEDIYRCTYRAIEYDHKTHETKLLGSVRYNTMYKLNTTKLQTKIAQILKLDTYSHSYYKLNY